MKQLLRLALAADVTALAALMLGSWTRINGAGLTCPDWPLCRGRLVPALGDGTLWEWSHRVLAGAIAALVLALIVAAWRQRAQSRFIAPIAATIAAFFLLQLFLGAETVRVANAPYSVVLHWATAMALIASISAMAVFVAASPDVGRRDASERTAHAVAILLGVTAVAAFATMCVGAYVSSSGAGLACRSIPGCAGNVVVYTSGQYAQMIHRIAAAATLICAAAAAALGWAQPASARVRRAAALGLVLISLQIVLGLLNVVLRLPTELREAHALNAALLFLAFFVATSLAVVDATPQRWTRLSAPNPLVR
ncbi:MAG: COX15/CtaA family protein [Candidatus Eremiobacteraeota bacterium]|nr:COX15/CtaA family protein [Candidatus Eremiobacteraeota bacterium]